MIKAVSYCSLVVSLGVVLALSASAPWVLSDGNQFLKNFVGTELLNVLGVILAITLASAANLHLTFNQIEERYKHLGGLAKTRANVHRGAYCLIILFVLAVGLVVVKPLITHDDWAQALTNGAALIIILWNVLILISLTRMAFAIQPEV